MHARMHASLRAMAAAGSDVGGVDGGARRPLRRASGVGGVSLLALLAAVACSSDAPPVAPPARAAPVVAELTVAANPTDALALNVAVTVDHADSVRLRLRVTGEMADRVLPATPSAAGRVELAALGLPADSVVTVRAEAFNATGATFSPPTHARTGALPTALRDVRLAVTGTPAPGYVLTGFVRDGVAYAVAFDSAGAVAWYRAFPEEAGVSDVQQQPNGDITVFLGATVGWLPAPGRFVELRPTGDVVRTYAAPAGYYTDNHELRLVGARGKVPTAYFFGYDRRPTDLTSRGGAADSLMAWHSIFRADPDGTVRRLFAALDQFGVADWIEPPAQGLGGVDHPNSLDVLPGGDLLVSWRNFGQLTRIDSATGEIRWRLGGGRSDFTIVGDPLGGFSAPHFARLLDDGHVLLFDNGNRHQPSESRAVEYALDPAARSATLVWEYRHAPPRFALFTGAVQRRANGNTVVAYAWNGVITEVAPDGGVLWEGEVRIGATSAAPLYRLLAIPSLYEYRRP